MINLLRWRPRWYRRWLAAMRLGDANRIYFRQAAQHWTRREHGVKDSR